MNWKIIYQDGITRKEILIDNKEYDEISKWLNKPKMVRLKNGMILNMSFIRIIEPDNQVLPLPKEFRIEKPKEEEEERIRVPGGFQKISTRKKLKQLWDSMKAKGSWKGFDSYENWEKETYRENIEGIEAISKK